MNEFVYCKKYSDGALFLKKYAIPLAKKAKDRSLANSFIYEVAFLKYLDGRQTEGISYWKKNKKEKEPFIQYKPSFLNIRELDQNITEFIEEEHSKFMKQILE